MVIFLSNFFGKSISDEGIRSGGRRVHLVASGSPEVEGGEEVEAASLCKVLLRIGGKLSSSSRELENSKL